MPRRKKVEKPRALDRAARDALRPTPQRITGGARPDSRRTLYGDSRGKFVLVDHTREERIPMWWRPRRARRAERVT